MAESISKEIVHVMFQEGIGEVIHWSQFTQKKIIIIIIIFFFKNTCGITND